MQVIVWPFLQRDSAPDVSIVKDCRCLAERAGPESRKVILLLPMETLADEVKEYVLDSPLDLSSLSQPETEMSRESVITMRRICDLAVSVWVIEGTFYNNIVLVRVNS